MKIDELIDDAIYCAERCEESETDELPFVADTLRKAAGTIRLLWEVAKDTTNEKYRMKFDEWSGNNDTQNAD